MAKKINIVGKKAERIHSTGLSLSRIEPCEFAAALGAEPCDERHSEHLDPISLHALGNELLKRLRSTGASLEGATEQCKVPLRPEDMVALRRLDDDTFDCDNEMKEPRLVLARLPGSFQLRRLLRLLPADLEET